MKGTPYFLSSKVLKPYSKISFQPGDALVFGSESHGLPLSLFEQYKENYATIPMREGSRCLNLASSAAIVTYEAYRQMDFDFQTSV